MTDHSRRNLVIAGGILGALVLAPLIPAACTAKRRRQDITVAENGPPERPKGQPKPMLEEDIAPVLARLDAWYAAHLPADKYIFNPPATDAKLDAFERVIGIKLPQSYRQLYRWHDGDNEKDDRFGHIYGLPILSLRLAEMYWREWDEALSGYFKGNPYEISGAAWPAGAVDPAYINPRWIPLTSDGSSNHIGLDFDPWPGGRIGQVIIFGRDEEVKVVLAESLGTFLDWIADLLESGNFRLETGKHEEVLRAFRLKTPASDSFADGARTLLGAPNTYSSL